MISIPKTHSHTCSLQTVFLLARCIRNAGEIQCAAELLPDEAVAYWCQGDIYKAQGQYRLAQEAYERAVRVAPENEQAHDKLAAWHDFRRGNKGQTEEMISLAFRNDQAATTVVLASRWLETHPDDLWVIHKYAEMLYKMTRDEEAIRVYLDAIEQFEEWRWGIYNQLGHLYRYRGDLKIAEEWYQKAIDEIRTKGQAMSFSVLVRHGKASCHRLRKRIDERLSVRTGRSMRPTTISDWFCAARGDSPKLPTVSVKLLNLPQNTRRPLRPCRMLRPR